MRGFLINTIIISVFLNFNSIIAQEQKDIVITLYRNSDCSLNNEKDFQQKRIQQLFNKERFLKCIKKSSRNIRRNKDNKVAYYYLALSTYEVYKEKSAPILFDRTLKFLKASQFNEDPKIQKYLTQNRKLIDDIHQEAIFLSESQHQGNRLKTLRRLQYVAELYDDSTDLYKKLVGLDNGLMIETSVSKGAEDKEIDIAGSIADKVVNQLERQLVNENQHSLSKFLVDNLGLEVDVHQAKIMDVSATQYGVCEFEGKEHNQEVIKYFKETGHEHIKRDETSWCSAYMSWCAKKAGLYYSNSLLARSWLKMGAKVIFPKPGDIVVFWREKINSWEGHVSIFLFEDKVTNEIFCLGGNQDGKVCVASYPSENVLGYRRIKPII